MRECNHGKSTKDLKVNPYMAGFSTRFIITEPGNAGKMEGNDMLMVKTIDDFEIDFDNPNPDEQENIKNLGLRQLYNEHRDLVLEIVDKYNASDYERRRGLIDTFQGIVHDMGELDGLIWSFHRQIAADKFRPLSKLTADILHILRKD